MNNKQIYSVFFTLYLYWYIYRTNGSQRSCCENHWEFACELFFIANRLSIRTCSCHWCCYCWCWPATNPFVCVCVWIVLFFLSPSLTHIIHNYKWMTTSSSYMKQFCPTSACLPIQSAQWAILWANYVCCYCSYIDWSRHFMRHHMRILDGHTDHCLVCSLFWWLCHFARCR